MSPLSGMSPSEATPQYNPEPAPLVNPAAEALVGRSSTELVGRPISEAFALASGEGAIEHPLLAVLRGWLRR